MAKKWGRRMLALLAGLSLLLGGCKTEPAVYTVRFAVNGTVAAEQTVQAGQSPQAYVPELTGAQFVGWQDPNGELVEPTALKISENIRFDAVIRPELTAHVPYLLTDESGLLGPEEPLRSDALAYALEALAAPGAKDYFPELPAGEEPVDMAALAGVLESFFPAERVNAVFAGEGTVTRAQFAAGMQILLGRSDDECFTLAQDARIPEDVNLEREDAAALLEASVAHTPEEEGLAWLELDLTTSHAPGFVNIDGYLYYVQENRHFLRDADLGMLHFGPDGRYTCGDEELDRMVAQILAPMVAENPDATRLELLRLAFDHCHLNYIYLRRDIYYFGQTGWEIEDAKEMVSTGRGNCYNFAAIFWALARGLGYEARAVSGTCTDTNQPHGWVIIAIDGEDYFFDPEWQYAYRDRGEKGQDMFMIPKGRIYYWTYKWRE